jgi:hypothetical protein
LATSTDLFLLQHAISEAADFTRGQAADVWPRGLAVVLDGLRPDRRRPSAMPAPPLEPEQLVGACSAWAPRRRR